MFGSGRFLSQQLDCVPKGFRLLLPPVRYYKDDALGVKIPRRIERGPTDILKALSSTVGRDSTSFHYKYPDDPYFYPLSPLRKKILALSLESGRKSARWIVKQHPEFFKEKLADPAIEAFLPKPVLNEDSEVAEETLLRAIEERNVPTAISLYGILHEKGISLSNDTKQVLLELVCFYNCHEKAEEENFEERWYELNVESERKKMWENGNFAEKLFESMDSNCPLALSTIIEGMFKHNKVEKAIELFRTRSKDVKLTVGVYNGLISNADKLEADLAKRWEAILGLLKEMNKEGIHPNVGTLNAVLKSLNDMSSWGDRIEHAWMVLAEFKKIGVEPSLGSYSYLIMMLCDTKASRLAQDFTRHVICTLRGSEIEIRHPSDLLFFPEVMTKCQKPFRNCELAQELNSLLFENNNGKFLSGFTNENIYFRRYLLLICLEESLEKTMEIFKQYVPTIWNPDRNFYKQILKKIYSVGGIEFLPEVYKQADNQKLTYNLDIVGSFLEGISSVFKSEEKLPEFFHSLGISVWNRLEEGQFDFRNFDVDNLFVSNLLIVLLKTNETEKALRLFEMLLNTTQTSLLELSGLSLEVLSRWLISENKMSEAVVCLKYAVAREYKESKTIAKQLLPHLETLQSKDKAWVVNVANDSSTAGSSEENPSV